MTTDKNGIDIRTADYVTTSATDIAAPVGRVVEVRDASTVAVRWEGDPRIWSVPSAAVELLGIDQ